MPNSNYDLDFYAWANEQAALLRAGKLSGADVEHIAEEIESMGRSEKRELVNRLAVLLSPLLKWRLQPGRRSAGWEASIKMERLRLADHLHDSPSLKSQAAEAIAAAYRRAVVEAAAGTGLAETDFPLTCPWSLEEMIGPNFWPE
jgi:hypothetical protein